jgi:predicted helicase
MAQAKHPISIFYSYAHEDEPLRDELEKHLSTLRREGLITNWHDRRIGAGTLWEQEIDKHLASAQIILLLISPDFIASDYCTGVEVQRALQRHDAGEARVIPVILRPTDWERMQFGRLQALPKDGRPVTKWRPRDAAFLDITKGIRAVIVELQTPRPRQPRRGPIGRAPALPVEDTTTDKAQPTATSTATALSLSTIKKALDHYYKELADSQRWADYESALRAHFQNLLNGLAKSINCHITAEWPLENGKRPDGTLFSPSNLVCGYWEAKGPKDDLDRQINNKIVAGYPLTNIVFENTKRAVLYQGNQHKPVFACDMTNRDDLAYLLQLFFEYKEHDIVKFETAVQEFKESIPRLAHDLLDILEKSHKENLKFINEFNSFLALCRETLDPNMSRQTIDEMLVQHLLTERLFRTVFHNSDFRSNNIIAVQIEKLIKALTFNRDEFLKSLDRFYIAIEEAARDLTDWTEKQRFLDTVYERFFQGFSVKQADTHGIVYTPQEIVTFMCASVDEVLQRQFNTSLSEPDVKILDPCTGTGNFIVNIIRHHIHPNRLVHKYRNDLFCNEIMLLPYYIASLNIEHAYSAKLGCYEPFEGICFTDTLELAQDRQLPLFFVEENTERVKREKEAQIMVVIGNPPYNVGQLNENDNNKNRKYEVIGKRIKETYGKASRATNRNALSDAYVKFFRWATDRLGGRDGIVCLVTNNSFVDQYAFDGMRQYLLKDFTHIYHLDLHGNVRKNPKLSGTTHNVFGIQVGVGITIAIRASSDPARKLYYYRVPEYWRKTEKLAFLVEKKSIGGMDWQELQPDARYTWITEGLHPEFATFLPMGVREVKRAHGVGVGGIEIKTIFKIYSIGVQTSRDHWMYDFNANTLAIKASNMIETYNADLSRWIRTGASANIDDFVLADGTRIKWSSRLKECLSRKVEAKFETSAIRSALYRPFTRQFLYFDSIMTHRQGLVPNIFPVPANESENAVIIVSDLAYRAQFSVLVANTISDIHVLASVDAFQCFPYYTYNEDSSNRRENITDWALEQFQTKYGEQVSKWDIFHYVYALLHHPQYRERYAENLKRDLPHIPLLREREAFELCVRVGRQLMELHLHYEQAEQYPLEQIINNDEYYSERVEKMRLSSDKTAVVVNKSLTLGGVPPECFQYRLGNRSALEWVIDQYRVSEDKRSGIVIDPNSLQDKGYIVRLLRQVVTVSVETMRLVRELEQGVKVEDWLERDLKGINQ